VIGDGFTRFTIRESGFSFTCEAGGFTEPNRHWNRFRFRQMDHASLIYYSIYQFKSPSVNNKPVKRFKRLTLVATGQVATNLLYWTACRLELWDSDDVLITQDLDVGYNVDQLD